jgi:hypothetical protein
MPWCLAACVGRRRQRTRSARRRRITRRIAARRAACRHCPARCAGQGRPTGGMAPRGRAFVGRGGSGRRRGPGGSGTRGRRPERRSIGESHPMTDGSRGVPAWREAACARAWRPVWTCTATLRADPSTPRCPGPGTPRSLAGPWYLVPGTRYLPPSMVARARRLSPKAERRPLSSTGARIRCRRPGRQRPDGALRAPACGVRGASPPPAGPLAGIARRWSRRPRPAYVRCRARRPGLRGVRRPAFARSAAEGECRQRARSARRPAHRCAHGGRVQERLDGALRAHASPEAAAPRLPSDC